MSLITQAQFMKLLDQNIREVAEKTYNDLPTMVPTFYRTLDSQSAQEEFYSVGSLPDIPEFAGKVQYLNIAPGFHTKIEPKEYAGGLQFERKFIDDKKFNVMTDRASMLMASAQRTREKLGANTFVNAFSSAFDFQTSEEGVALCSSAHTTKSGVSTASGFSNAGSSALSKTAVAATRILMRKFRNDIGERIEVSDNLALVVPDALSDTAMEIVGTDKGLYTAEGTKNMQYGRYQVIPYLRLDDFDATNWYMVDLASMKKNLIWLDRVKTEIDNTVDFETKVLKTSVYFRCAYGFLDWRWIYGHNV